MIDGPSPVFLGKEFLHLPVALLGANTELEILFCNRIPVLNAEFSECLLNLEVGNAYLINHHHSEKITYRGKEKSIEIVLHVVADGIAEDVQNDLSDYKEEDAKGNVSQRPSIL